MGVVLLGLSLVGMLVGAAASSGRERRLAIAVAALAALGTTALLTTFSA